MLWKPTKKENAQFKQFIRYEKGKRSSRYNWVLFMKSYKLFHGNKQITSIDSVQTLNGIYTWYTKKGLLLEEFYYKNGFIIKHINRDFRRKSNIDKAHEIMEWDYSSDPFKQHYMKFKTDGTIKYNHYVYCQDTNYWYHEDAIEVLSDKVTDFKNVPAPKPD